MLMNKFNNTTQSYQKNNKNCSLDKVTNFTAFPDNEMQRMDANGDFVYHCHVHVINRHLKTKNLEFQNYPQQIIYSLLGLLFFFIYIPNQLN